MSGCVAKPSGRVHMDRPVHCSVASGSPVGSCRGSGMPLPASHNACTASGGDANHSEGQQGEQEAASGVRRVRRKQSIVLKDPWRLTGNFLCTLQYARLLAPGLTGMHVWLLMQSVLRNSLCCLSLGRAHMQRIALPGRGEPGLYGLGILARHRGRVLAAELGLHVLVPGAELGGHQRAIAHQAIRVQGQHARVRGHARVCQRKARMRAVLLVVPVPVALRMPLHQVCAQIMLQALPQGAGHCTSPL